jgi:hypothetical protein
MVATEVLWVVLVVPVVLVVRLTAALYRQVCYMTAEEQAEEQAVRTLRAQLVELQRAEVCCTVAPQALAVVPILLVDIYCHID